MFTPTGDKFKTKPKLLLLLFNLTFVTVLVSDVSAAPRQHENSKNSPAGINGKKVLSLESVQVPQKHELLDLNDFKITLTPANPCSGQKDEERLFFLILVHSDPRNFRQRQVIRETWGSVKEIKRQMIKVVFLLGKPEVKAKRKIIPKFEAKPLLVAKKKSMRDPKIMPQDLDGQIASESATFGDIVQGNFIDSLKNSSYKHLMGYKFVHDSCIANKKKETTDGPVFLIKTEDDVFMEIYHLFSFANAIYGARPSSRSLICDVIPGGTPPRRRLGGWLEEVKTKEHFESTHEAVKPDYCSGVAYLMTPDLTTDFLKVSTKIPKFWVDEIYVTGQLREALNLQPFYLNLRYTYETATVLRWLDSESTLPMPYLFASLNTKPTSEISDWKSWKSVMERLWTKTKAVHERSTN